MSLETIGRLETKANVTAPEIPAATEKTIRMNEIRRSASFAVRCAGSTDCNFESIHHSFCSSLYHMQQVVRLTFFHFETAVVN